jgi:hypothetical protein
VSSRDENADETPIRLLIGTDGEAFVRVADPQRVVEAARKRLADLSETRAHEARVVRRLTYGLADTLVDDAHIGVVRDPVERTTATIIVSSAIQDDRLLLIAKALLRADEKALPSVEARRVLLAWPDGRIRLQTNGGTYWRRHEYQVINVRSYGFDNLRLHTESVSPTLVRGVGTARVVVLPVDGPPPAIG